MASEWSGYAVCRNYLRQLERIEQAESKIKQLKDEIQQANNEAVRLNQEIHDSFIRSGINSIVSDAEVIVLVDAELHVIPLGYSCDLIGPTESKKQVDSTLAEIEEAA